jgi:hypothetical protein
MSIQAPNPPIIKQFDGLFSYGFVLEVINANETIVYARIIRQSGMNPHPVWAATVKRPDTSNQAVGIKSVSLPNSVGRI